jgi:hypothetical protein
MVAPYSCALSDVIAPFLERSGMDEILPSRRQDSMRMITLL